MNIFAKLSTLSTAAEFEAALPELEAELVAAEARVETSMEALRKAPFENPKADRPALRAAVRDAEQQVEEVIALIEEVGRRQDAADLAERTAAVTERMAHARKHIAALVDAWERFDRGIAAIEKALDDVERLDTEIRQANGFAHRNHLPQYSIKLVGLNLQGVRDLLGSLRLSSYTAATKHEFGRAS